MDGADHDLLRVGRDQYGRAWDPAPVSSGVTTTSAPAFGPDGSPSGGRCCAFGVARFRERLLGGHVLRLAVAVRGDPASTRAAALQDEAPIGLSLAGSNGNISPAARKPPSTLSVWPVT